MFKLERITDFVKFKNSGSNEIFKFIKPDDNDKLSEMKGFDLQDLLFYLDDYYLSLRDELGLSEDVTFGLELEFEYAMQKRIEDKLWDTGLFSEWITKIDTSLTDGAEINSPILKDEKKSWEQLQTVCDIVSPNAKIGSHSGGHIHIGAQTLGANPESWINFAGLWAAYENIIFRFGYGNFLTSRETMDDYSKTISPSMRSDYEYLKGLSEVSLKDVIRTLDYGKYCAVNLNHVVNPDRFITSNTIEFRCPNGTLDATIWQNNVNLFTKLLRYATSKDFDEDTINRRWEQIKDKFTDLRWYDEIYLSQALELCDLIFDNNLDKVYFLKQYLKSFATVDKRIGKAKPFTLRK